MVNLILNFISCSRASGLRISTSEVLDCMKQLEMVDILEEPLFKNVLRANFAKSRTEQSKFEQVYHLFFHELRSQASIPHSDTLAKWMKMIMDSIKRKLDDDPVNQAIMDFITGDPLAYLEQMRDLETDGGDTTDESETGYGELMRRLQILSQINAIGAAASRYLAANRLRITYEERQALETHFQDRMDIAKRLLSEDEEPLERPQIKESYESHIDRLSDKSFFSLNKKEVDEMREVVEQLVRKLKDTIQRRQTRNDRGVLDIKKTIRSAAKYEGTPMEIIFKKRPKRKGKIVTLCDVSGSVWSAARFMLNMLYSLQDCFLQVRSFIFVAELEEVTKIFEKYEINQAIDKALKEADINYNASTNYGTTFKMFKRKYLDILNKKTTLIIVGDGRTNYANPEESIFREMKDRCRRVIWLNPESTRFWRTGDSRMDTYTEHCHEVRHCQNLNQLVDFIKSLVL